MGDKGLGLDELGKKLKKPPTSKDALLNLLMGTTVLLRTIFEELVILLDNRNARLIILPMRTSLSRVGASRCTVQRLLVFES
eukprot:1175984-Prorocentrum_minimum.AAC.4